MSNPLWMQMRPRSFDEFLGNHAAIDSLSNLTRGAVLIHGPYGCGKTSAALVLAAKALGIDEPIPVNGARFIDPFTYAAHWLGQDIEAKDLKALYMISARRVLIFDEAQEMSGRLQVRLQTLVETAEGSENLIILCTTDLPKLGEALRSRTRPFSLGPLSGDDCGELVEVGWHKLKGTYDPPRDLLAALKEYKISIPRLILQVVDMVADGNTPREAAAAVTTAVRS